MQGLVDFLLTPFKVLGRKDNGGNSVRSDRLYVDDGKDRIRTPKRFDGTAIPRRLKIVMMTFDSSQTKRMLDATGEFEVHDHVKFWIVPVQPSLAAYSDLRIFPECRDFRITLTHPFMNTGMNAQGPFRRQQPIPHIAWENDFSRMTLLKITLGPLGGLFPSTCSIWCRDVT